MGTNRREFLRNMSLGIGSLGVFGLSAQEAQAKIKKKIKEVKHLSAAEVARDEDFWFPVQQAFNTDRSIINLNNGGVHPAPKIVMDAVHRYLDFANGAPVLNSWRYLRRAYSKETGGYIRLQPGRDRDHSKRNRIHADRPSWDRPGAWR